MSTAEAPDDSAVMQCIRAWQQGDCVLGELDFVAVNADGEGELSPCQGWLITSQTCDIVRDVADRPDVEVAALVKTEPETWRAASKGLRPRSATVRSLEDAWLASTAVALCKSGVISRHALLSLVKHFSLIRGWRACDGGRG